jgi:F-type H+-transporting ATPase subunit b
MKIDWWTLGIQTVNVLILVWLLQRFFWRPVAAMIQQRRDVTQRSLTEAEATRSKAAAALAEIEQTRAGFARERETILSAAHDAAVQVRTTLLEDATKRAACLEAAAKAEIEKEKHAAELAWSERSSNLAIEIAQRLAARLDGSLIRATFLDWLIKEIGTLPDATRHAVVANGANLEVISATALDPADEERTRSLIGKAFGGQPAIIFKTDPALIAGLELLGPHLIITNSWRADLEKIFKVLTHEH